MRDEISYYPSYTAAAKDMAELVRVQDATPEALVSWCRYGWKIMEREGGAVWGRVNHGNPNGAPFLAGGWINE